jgi:hypothetical protein
MDYRTLSVELGDEELKQKSDVLATRIEELDEVEQQRKSAMDGFKDHIKEIQGDISSLARQLRTRRENRVTPCMWERDDARMSMLLIRQDTGEIVETRPMRDDERQPSLFAEAPPPVVSGGGTPEAQE